MIYYLIGSVVLMLAGLVGVVFPAVPGIPLMAVVAIVFQIFTKGLSTATLIILLSITLLSILIDYLSGILGAKYSGANAKSMLLGIIGMLLCIGFIPPLGAIIGLFIGILTGELIFKKDAKKAIKAASSGVVSSIIGIILNLILGLSFLTIFIVSAIRTI